MRLWSIHPKYPDTIGLIAVWREGLLAKKVLEGKTKGYTKHPELDRFRKNNTIDTYLFYVWKEASERGHNFDKTKIGKLTSKKIEIPKEQLLHEFEHLKNKLRTRTPKRYKELLKIKNPKPHPLFVVEYR